MNQPFQISSLKMDFDPEVFHIKDSQLKIARSDFSLTGSLNNILSHFRSDSLLRGDFTFVSSTTDVLQLMGLTSGMGDRTVKTTPEPSSESSGPYMLSVRTVLPKSKYSKTSVAFWQKSGLAQSAMLSTERSVRLQQPVVVALGQLSVWATCSSFHVAYCYPMYGYNQNIYDKGN